MITSHPLLDAIDNGDISLIDKELLRLKNVSELDRQVPDGLIQRALRTQNNSRMHTISLLAHMGARVNIPNRFGIPPLCDILTSSLDNVSDKLRALSSLLKAGADPNECVIESRVENIFGYTEKSHGNTAPLCIAAQVGDLPSLELLLSAGAHPDAPNSLFSPLRVAIRYQQYSCISALLIRGADINYVDGEKSVALTSIKDCKTFDLMEAAGANLVEIHGENLEPLLQVICLSVPDDTLLRLLGARFNHTIWERDRSGENAIGKLWRRWSTQKNEWIPKLIADWEEAFLEKATAGTSGKGRPARL